MDAEIGKIYGNKVRVRACGLCWQHDRLLLVNHKGLTSANFWAPPGGGVEFGETLAECLKRELAEETGLTVTVGDFRFGCELVRPPLHGVELFFDVTVRSGNLQAGFDPELQIIDDARFFSFDEIRSLPPEQRHGIFNYLTKPDDIGQIRGFYMI
jgi:8-oxo-dGTP diphosphatase